MCEYMWYSACLVKHSLLLPPVCCMRTHPHMNADIAGVVGYGMCLSQITCTLLPLKSIVACVHRSRRVLYFSAPAAAAAASSAAIRDLLRLPITRSVLCCSASVMLCQFAMRAIVPSELTTTGPRASIFTGSPFTVIVCVSPPPPSLAGAEGSARTGSAPPRQAAQPF